MELILSGDDHIVLNGSKLRLTSPESRFSSNNQLSVVTDHSGFTDIELKQPINRITLRGDVSLTLNSPNLASSVIITASNKARIYSSEKIEIDTVIIRTDEESYVNVSFFAKHGYITTHDKSVVLYCQFKEGSVKVYDRSILVCKIDPNISIQTDSTAMLIV